MDLLKNLNDPQKEAVLHEEGPLLVLAGAGSGKTAVITTRIARLLLERGVPPHRVFGVTFTNKAAREMLERVEKFFGGPVRGMWLTTFHSAGALILRRHPEKVGRSARFVIYDDSDQLAMVSRTMRDLGINDRIYQPRAIQHQINTAKNFGLSPRRFTGSDFLTDVVAKIYPVYEDRMAKADAVDFGDLLYLVTELFAAEEDVRMLYAERFLHILVDEFQDTNPVQYKLLRQLTSKYQNICVVGDDDQCLIGGTKITMADGSERLIEQIREGDEVLSNYGSGDFRAARVTQVFRKHYDGEGVAITLRSGRRLVSTPEHNHFAGYQLDVMPPIYFSLPANRRNVVVTLCGDRRGASPMHRISIVGNDTEGQDKLRELGFSVRFAKEGSASWRFETVSADFGRISQMVDALRQAFDLNVFFTARLGKNGQDKLGNNSLPFLPAASVMPGMVMFTQEGSYDVVEQVDRVPLQEVVYDLNIERTHNFVANGIVTHNSIYRWRGADVKNILGFPKDFPNTTTIKLEENYRSTQNILKAAYEVIRNNFGRHEKVIFTQNNAGDPVYYFTLEDERREADTVAGIIRGLSLEQGIPHSEIAVFYRTHAQSRAIEEALQRTSIPYRVVGGLRFYDRAEVKDLLAYLKVLTNRADLVSWTRIVNTPSRGIGDATVEKLIAYTKTSGATFWDAMRHAATSSLLRPGPKKRVLDFGRLMSELYDLVGKLLPSEIAREVLARTGYLENLEKEDTPEAEARVENLRELLGSMMQYEQESESPETLESFLERVSLVNQDEESKGKDVERVTLMTVHAAKGLEFDGVIITGLEEGTFPHARSRDDPDEMEEERRLCYVALTRARRRLYLLNARRRRIFGQEQPTLPSRFLGDIPKEILITHGGRPTAYAQPSWSSGSLLAVSPPAPEEKKEKAPSYELELDLSVDQRPESERPKNFRFQVGMRVRHSVFGEGEVRKVGGHGPSGVLTISFSGSGVRKIQAGYVTPL